MIERDTSNNLLDLLYPCANLREKAQVGQDRYLLSYSKKNPNDLSQYEFLGTLMGICIRTSVSLIIDLPQFIWKQLVGQAITIDDLVEIEYGQLQKFKQILNDTEEAFNENKPQWVVTMGDETKYELIPGGASKDVEYDQRFEYVSESIYIMLKQCMPQAQAIRRGIAQIIPDDLL